MRNSSCQSVGHLKLIELTQLSLTNIRSCTNYLNIYYSTTHTIYTCMNVHNMFVLIIYLHVLYVQSKYQLVNKDKRIKRMVINHIVVFTRYKVFSRHPHRRLRRYHHPLSVIGVLQLIHLDAHIFKQVLHLLIFASRVG